VIRDTSSRSSISLSESERCDRSLQRRERFRFRASPASITVSSQEWRSRGAQFVAERGEELVFDAIGLTLLGIERVSIAWNPSAPTEPGSPRHPVEFAGESFGEIDDPEMCRAVH